LATWIIAGLLAATGPELALAQALDFDPSPPTAPAVANTPEFPVLQAGADLFRGIFTIATLGGEVSVYGQISPTLQFVDDGTGSYSGLLDNGNSQSRIGLLSDVPLRASTLRLRAEFGLGIPKTNQSSQTSNLSYTTWGDPYVRYFEARISGQNGILTFGQGDMATNNAASNDASGTKVAGNVQIRDSAGGFLFREADGTLSDIRIGDVFDAFNANRRVRVRYDTPVWSGFSFAAAYSGPKMSNSGTETDYDAAVNYAGTFQDVAVNASLGLARQEGVDGNRYQNYVGSVALLHKPSGFNLSVASGGIPGGARYGYVKAGWLGDPLNVGSTAVAVEYYDGQNFKTLGTSSSARGFMAVQGFDDLSLEAYLAYREYTFNDPASGPYRDLSSVLAGLRWKF
jgi:hypothetical protein